MSSNPVIGPRRPQAILFDAGGTLVLQDPVALGTKLDFVIEAEAAFDAHYRAMSGFARRRLAGHPDTWTWWQEHYFAALGVPDHTTAGTRVDNGYGLWSLPLPGSVEAVKEIRAQGIRTGVVSNSDGSVGQSLVDAGFAGLFEVVVDSHEVGVAKPDPAIFLYTLQRAGLEAADTWYVGDSIYHDVGGARAAGLARVWLIDPLDLHPEWPDRISGVAALPRLLDDLDNP
ncbi:MAG TPA: HAD-IA family hydrolase [Acidimicrobiia bacterium]|nr:HAD-IA family hydrolase [Acidimicrobiia bacterium]